MTRLPLLALILLVGCSGSTGGTGGGSGGGTSTGGGTGGSGGGSAGGTGGGSAGGTGGGTTATVPLADFCTRFAEAGCAFSIRCGSATPSADCAKLTQPDRFALINARKDCVTSVTRAGLDAGRTTYNGARALACFTGTATTAACNQLFQYYGADCAGIFTGSVAQGGSCYGGSDCAPTLYCDSTALLCPGTCKPRIPAGGFTGTSTACAVGTFFISQNDGGGSCRAPVGPGENCTPLPGTFTPLFCTGENGCLTATDGGRTCQPTRPAGSACSVLTSSDCAYGTTCGPGDGGQQCVPLKKSGEACSGSGLGIPCQSGLSCTNNLCSPLVAAGGSCFEDRDCIAGHVCGAGQLCRAVGTVDAGCNTANFQDDCAVGLFCGKPAARCEPRRGLDALCPNGNECSLELGVTCRTPTDGGAARCGTFMCLTP
ncbi:MAG: Tryptophan synthase alpha chain [Myxococcaceae bacterium]|nr:Tryptophan synthase alpha chain [Myxococcaceae bacterium]